MAHWHDRRVAEQTRKVSGSLRDLLQAQGFRTTGPKESDTPGAFVVEAELLDGFRVTVEVTGEPWRNDGSVKGEK